MGAGLDAAGTSAYMCEQGPPLSLAEADASAGAMSWLDSQSWVVKYSWFGAMTSDAYLGGVSDGNRLMDDSGNLNALWAVSALTMAVADQSRGKQYVNGGTA